MIAVYGGNPQAPKGGEPIDTRSYIGAILNILDDSAEEKAHLANAQRAVVNILEDAASEANQLDAAKKALLNILDDATVEKGLLADTQRAILNILADAASETVRLNAAQKAVLNILEDSTEEKARLADTQRAVLNILDDFDAEKKKVEQANASLLNEVAERTRAEEALRKAKDAAEGANRELEAFSYSVAHDLRAPLRSIDGFSQALLEDCADKLDEQGKVYLGYVRESAQQMARLIDDLLSLSRVSRAQLHRSQVDLSVITRIVFAYLQRSQPDRVVELVLPENLAAFGDPRLLRIALENILGNAWKFTGKCASARIEVGQERQEGRRVYYVRDNGAGFDMAYADKLFAVFQRLHTTTEFDGTGIGLAIVQRVIHRHNGRIWAEGEVGRGATFYFTLEEGA